MFISSDKNTLSLYFEKFDGKTILQEGHLMAVIRANILPFFPVSNILLIMELLIKTVKYLEKKQLTHRDFSNTNILYNFKDEEIKVIDFGLCTTLNHST